MITKRYIKIGRFIFNLNLSIYFLPKTKTQGVYNRIPETPFKVLFLDYDRGMRLPWIEEEIRYFQDTMNMGDVVILESSPGSYHVVGFDYLTQEEENRIVWLANCDDAFKKSELFDFKSKVLRTFPKGLTPKPKYIKTVKSNINVRKKSMGHIKYYKWHFAIKDLNETNAIDTGIDLIEYPTKNNVRNEKGQVLQEEILR